MNRLPDDLLLKIIRKVLSNGGDYADVFKIGRASCRERV